MPTLRTDEVEAAVYAQVANKLSEFRAVRSKADDAMQDAITKKKIELDEIASEIDGLVKKIPFANDTVMGYINKAITDLETRKTRVKSEIAELISNDNHDGSNEILGFFSMWDKLTISDKVLVLDQIVSKVYLNKDKITILWKI